MSDYSTNSTINLNVNGKNVEDKLKKYEKDLVSLRQQAQRAAEIGDRGTLAKVQKEIVKTENQMRKVQTATANVEHTLQNLDKARPNNLRKDLQTLKSQLNGIERGTAAWDAHVAKIRLVQEELKKINSALKEQESFWDSFNRKMNEWQTTLMAAIAAITGVIMAARSAVKEFVDMDAVLANVRKFTGLSADEVERLNSEFKKLDTRTQREDLNGLAQEAGRLGKNSVEDVMGFVKAANQINVALDDLGDGATLTLSKLTNIFGDEQRLGTEEALLSVGSVINELSQNCTAAAPYLANFAQRMAGVGAQAGLTIPQIMAFGAVLDSQGQAVEMSATSLSKLTMDLFKDTEKVAKAVGIPLAQMQEALSKGTNEGLIMLLERLHNLGDMSVLAPVFKDMGENGARASQVIAALAGNIETLKWQQEEANKAYNEATSVTKEYNVQNNTQEAIIEKNKKKIYELAIELGEKLLPVMSHVISSSTVLLKIMSSVVSFFINNAAAITTATIAIAAYTVAVNASNIAFKVHYGWLILVEKGHKLVQGAMALSKVVTTGLTLAYERLVWQTRGANTAQQNFNKALKAASSSSVIGLAITAIAALALAIYKYLERIKEARKQQQFLNEIRKNAIENAQEQIDKVRTLHKVANDENEAMEKRKKAVENLNKIIPGYNAQIDETTGKLRESKKALDNYIDSLIHQYEVEGAKDKIRELGKEKADAEVEKANALEEQKNIGEAPDPKKNPYAYISPYAAQAYSKIREEAQEKVDAAQKKIDNAVAKIEKIRNVYGKDIEDEYVNDNNNDNDDENENSGGGGGGNDNSSSTKDKFAAEKEWKQKEEAINRIAYATGEKDYEEYQKRILDIEIEYQNKILEHQDLTNVERLEAQAAHDETVMKIRKEGERRSIEQVKSAYEDLKKYEMQRYADGKSSYEEYTNALHLLELKQMREEANVYEEGSKEKLEAQQKYNKALLEDQISNRKKVEDLQKKEQDSLKKIKESTFGLNAKEKQAQYASEISALSAVYNMEILAAEDNAEEKLRIEEAFQKAKLALGIKYGIISEEEGMTRLQILNERMMAWLKNDEGKAVTGALDTAVSSMSAIFSAMSEIVQSELSFQTASIEKRYSVEISAAEGNMHKVNQIEKKKEEDIAKAKNEANKKMFAMQVIQAIANTAQSAISAYSSAAQVPMIGYLLAPIAAASAIAAGRLQVNAIKKQQQASEAQGYAEGGYTPSGDKYKPVGVVHAGEWVASQKLLANPSAAAIIESLDYAQKNNTIGSISPSMVNEDIAAPMVLARSSTQKAQKDQDISDTLSKLNERLSEPFVTVNTVTGDYGTKKAQEEYEKYIRNKTPKFRYK